jgi:hypothetical protein
MVKGAVMTTTGAWGPLAGLIGEWIGEQGVDSSFHNAKGKVGETPYREKCTFEPFGPVVNGQQELWGLDYRMAAWRPNEENPFHTEIGYWLWDGATGHIMRCFMVPRGTTLLAGGIAAPGDTSFSLEANVGSEICGILSNHYLSSRARTTKYTCSIKLDGDSFSYDSCTTYVHSLGGEIAHTDSNVLRRVPSAR